MNLVISAARKMGIITLLLVTGSPALAQRAFMIGFADQSNFACAFKRWSGMSPGQFEKVA